MNYKIILLIFTTFILAGCNQDNQNKNSIKFTPDYLNKIMNIKANQFGDNKINNIPVDYVIAQSEKIINLNN